MKFLISSKLWANVILLLSVGCIATVAFAVFSVRGGSLDLRSAIGIITPTAKASVAVLVCALIMFVFASATRVKTALATVLVLVPLLGIYFLQPAPTPNAVPGQRQAPLNDISTDTLNPPIYEAVVSLRPEGSNTLVYPGESAAKIQAERFPSIAPLTTALSVEQAFNVALEVVNNNGWEVIYADANTGIIEAVAATLVFNFKDDLVIRITPTATGSTLDMRSRSRIGRSDMNKNGLRVIAFMADFTEQVEKN